MITGYTFNHEKKVIIYIMGNLISTSNHSVGNSSGSSYTSTGTYTAPSYINGDMNNQDLMDTKNTNYADMVSKKKNFLGAFYSSYAAMFNGSSIADIAEGTPSSATYKTQTANYNNSKSSSSTGYSEMISKSEQVQKKRLKMDADISRLSSSRNLLNKNDPSILYNSHFYVNLLWIILATTLIYYIFTEL